MAHLLDIHVVHVTVVDVDRVHALGLDAVDRHGMRREVPHNRPRGADDLQAAAVVPLEVVEVNLTQQPRLEAERHLRQVLRIARQVAVVPRRADDLGRLPEEPAQVVELVNGVEQDAATQRGADRIVVPIVAARPPVGKVGAELCPHGEQSSDALVFQQGLDASEAREEAEVEAHREHAPASPRLFDQRRHAVTGVRDGLLHEEMSARRERLTRRLQMKGGRRTDQHRVRRRGQRAFEARGRFDAGPRGRLTQTIAVGVPDLHPMAESGEVSAVPGSDRAPAHDKETHHRPRSFRSSKISNFIVCPARLSGYGRASTSRCPSSL